MKKHIALLVSLLLLARPAKTKSFGWIFGSKKEVKKPKKYVMETSEKVVLYTSIGICVLGLGSIVVYKKTEFFKDKKHNFANITLDTHVIFNELGELVHTCEDGHNCEFLANNPKILEGLPKTRKELNNKSATYYEEVGFSSKKNIKFTPLLRKGKFVFIAKK